MHITAYQRQLVWIEGEWSAIEYIFNLNKHRPAFSSSWNNSNFTTAIFGCQFKRKLISWLKQSAISALEFDERASDVACDRLKPHHSQAKACSVYAGLKRSWGVQAPFIIRLKMLCRNTHALSSGSFPVYPYSIRLEFLWCQPRWGPGEADRIGFEPK